MSAGGGSEASGIVCTNVEQWLERHPSIASFVYWHSKTLSGEKRMAIVDRTLTDLRSFNESLERYGIEIQEQLEAFFGESSQFIASKVDNMDERVCRFL